MAQRLRQWIRFLRRARPGPIVLMYHRIAEPRWDPWDLAVAPARFAEQMALLRRSRTVLPLDRLVGQRADGVLPDDAAAVTFDDGYRDNLTVAKPILDGHAVPATVFLATGAIGAAAGFWWDELADLILGAAAIRGSLRQGGVEIDLPPPEPADGSEWRAATGAGTRRQRLYLEVWRQFRALDEPARQAGLAELRSVLGPHEAEPDSLPMAADEIRALVDGGLVTVGAHTVTHPALGAVPPERQRTEIAASVAACRELVGDAVRGFAYPYGDRSASAIAAVRACGLGWACSTEPRAISAGDDRHDLPRFQVGDWDGEAFARNLGLRELRAARAGHA